jgi:hypothetical protein
MSLSALLNFKKRAFDPPGLVQHKTGNRPVKIIFWQAKAEASIGVAYGEQAVENVC